MTLICGKCGRTWPYRGHRWIIEEDGRVHRPNVTCPSCTGLALLWVAGGFAVAAIFFGIIFLFVAVATGTVGVMWPWIGRRNPRDVGRILQELDDDTKGAQR